MKINILDYNKKIELLAEAILGGKQWQDIEAQIAPSLCTKDLFTVFLSVCDTYRRARVCRHSAATLEEAWAGAVIAARRYISAKEIDARWIKADIMCSSRREKLSKVISKIADSIKRFYRRGIAFDENNLTAITESELNASLVISYKNMTIELEAVNRHLKKVGAPLLEELPQEVTTFYCLSWFSDEHNEVHSLYGRGAECGRRVVERFEKQNALEVITSGSEYLAMMMDMQGVFQYGVLPINHKELPGYNMVRHAGSIWGLVCAYRITRDRFVLQKLELAIGHLVRNSFYKYKKPKEEENTAYIAELTTHDVKLGGSGIAILALTEYMNVVGGDKYKKLCIELGNGMLELMNTDTGEFVHVLNFPELTVKEKYRTVYYDGEAAFAFVRLYSLTKDERWLKAATKAVDRFIATNYEKYRDHWVAYAMNELTKYVPEEKYFEFGLKNANVNLDYISKRNATCHTYLELLCATYELYERIVDSGISVSYLKEFDSTKLIDTIFSRANNMLNGFTYPEVAMYLRYPEKIVGSFYIRQEGYRIRIDDIQHFCGAYCMLYRHFERIDEMRQKIESTRS